MSTLALFATGVFVTLIVSAAMGVLIYGAILDGRDNAQRAAAEELRLPVRSNTAPTPPTLAA